MDRRKHILIIDDNNDVREVIAELLQAQGYRVSVATGGADMREALKRDDPVDAVVLDSLMPGERSASLARHLKELDLPVVMISGSHDAMEIADLHGLQLLRKPFRSQDLCDALETALASGKFGQREA